MPPPHTPLAVILARKQALFSRFLPTLFKIQVVFVTVFTGPRGCVVVARYCIMLLATTTLSLQRSLNSPNEAKGMAFIMTFSGIFQNQFNQFNSIYMLVHEAP